MASVVVVGIPLGNAQCAPTQSRSIELVDFSADTLRHAKIWDGVRLARSVPVDSATTTDRSVRGVFSSGELEEAIRSRMISGAARYRLASESEHGYFGPMDAAIEVRRTIERSQMTAFWVTLRGFRAHGHLEWS